jgi:leader peptidase (prepilin peptidase) / N-methyltransferase
MADVLVFAYPALIGAVLGSFLNVCIYRWPREESGVRPRSRCGTCGAGVAWYDNIPVVSWLLLRGRCRRCRAGISAQYPVIELATAVVWVTAVVRFGPTLEALHSATFLTLLLGIAMTDAREMVIPDQFTLVGAGLGILLAALSPALPLGGALLGAGAAYALLRAVKLIAERALGKPALGVGDIHMMLMVGAFLGTLGAVLTIMLGSLLGVLIGVPYMKARGRLSAMETYLPLGVFLAMGAAVAHVWRARSDRYSELRSEATTGLQKVEMSRIGG